MITIFKIAVVKKVSMSEYLKKVTKEELHECL